MKKPLIITALVLLNACSPVMEANRPDPVNIKQIVIGENRSKVLSDIGSPLATSDDVPEGSNADSCDIYKLYTRGPDDVGKGAIAAGEIVADVFTLALAEVIFTPMEAATKNEKHTVTFCYSEDSKLVLVNQSDTAVND